MGQMQISLWFRVKISFLQMEIEMFELPFPLRNGSAIFPKKSLIYNPETKQKQTSQHTIFSYTSSDMHF